MRKKLSGWNRDHGDSWIIMFQKQSWTGNQQKQIPIGSMDASIETLSKFRNWSTNESKSARSLSRRSSAECNRQMKIRLNN